MFPSFALSFLGVILAEKVREAAKMPTINGKNLVQSKRSQYWCKLL
jgi:hypothetical protein